MDGAIDRYYGRQHPSGSPYESEKPPLPSKRYWEQVKTYEDHCMFIASGMAWVVEPNCPSSWKEHKELLAL